MSHRSRLTAVLVDVPSSDRERAVAFWSGALGQPGKQSKKWPEYQWYGEVTPGIVFMVQGTGDTTPRVHIDFETDDVEAEVARLKALGATEVQRVESWVVMRDPVGVIFCVVEVQVREMFEQHATTWD